MHQLKTDFSPFSSTPVTASSRAIQKMIKSLHVPQHAPTNIHFFPCIQHWHMEQLKSDFLSQQQHYSNSSNIPEATTSTCTNKKPIFSHSAAPK
jgi:hypothetical protein